MKHLIAALITVAAPAAADPASAVRNHILPRFDAFVAAAQDLAALDCNSPALESTFQDAAEGWAGVAHLQMGPIEDAGRGQSILFWPDDRDAIRRGLDLLAARDADTLTPDAVTRASIAARGLGALERLIFERDAQPCALTQALTQDLASQAGDLRDGWRDRFADLMLTAGADGNTRFRDPREPDAALFTALIAGLENIADRRIGIPLNAPDAPAPRRAELWRSGSSVPMIVTSLTALRGLVTTLSSAPSTTARIDAAIDLAQALPDPSLQDLNDDATRQTLLQIQDLVRQAADSAQVELGDALGLDAGFNGGDGD